MRMSPRAAMPSSWDRLATRVLISIVTGAVLFCGTCMTGTTAVHAAPIPPATIPTPMNVVSTRSNVSWTDPSAFTAGVSMYSNGTVYARVTGAGDLILRVRGDQCKGAPVLNLTIDDVRRAPVTVSATLPTDRVLARNLAEGTHRVELAFRNDLYRPKCDRNVHLLGLSMSVPTSPSSPVPSAPDPSVWKLAVDEQFQRSAAPGSFPAIYEDTFGVYGPYPTSHAGWWLPENLSVKGGVLNMYQGWKDGRPTSAGMSVRIPASNRNEAGHMTYGRSEIRARIDSPMPGYGGVALWWPKSGWPSTGELDFPEGDFHGDVYAFTHLTGKPTPGDTNAHRVGPTWSEWHTYVTEWAPGYVAYFVDGKEVGRDTLRTPSTPFTFAIQTGAPDKANLPSPHISGNLQIDHLRIWQYIG